MSLQRTLRRRPPAPEQGNDWGAMSPLLRRLHAARGARSIDDTQPRLASLLAPGALLGIDAAVDLLLEAIASSRHIVVVGDFDCDGATACALGVRGLRMLGATRVSHAVPNRQVHGYGLSPGLVADLAQMQPQLLVTVDHGIACHAGIAAAKLRGWQVLVTDHHLPGATLPPADAIVNPNQHGDGFASKAIAGVGVMFYLLLALRAKLRTLGDGPATTADLGTLLDLVAVGTVADLVPLDANNRSLVAAGLRRLRAGHGCAGLRALIEVAGRDESTLTASDIGFALAPRINAAGRLDDMAVGIECLLTDDPAHARTLAAALHAINAQRQGVQQQMVAEAEAAVSQLSLDGDLPAAPCLFDPHWHAGVVGLVASRIKERLHRPVFAFAPVEPGSDQLRGSARSIPGLHIRDLLAAVDATHPGLIQRFGGHAMAAGLSLSLAALPEFDRALQLQAERLLDSDVLGAEIVTDGGLQAHELDISHARELRDGGPWGQAYPEPMFDGEFKVLSWRVVGERHLKYELAHAHSVLNAIEFGGWTGAEPPDRISIAYRLEPDSYRGGDAIQLVVAYRESVPPA